MVGGGYGVVGIIGDIPDTDILSETLVGSGRPGSCWVTFLAVQMRVLQEAF